MWIEKKAKEFEFQCLRNNRQKLERKEENFPMGKIQFRNRKGKR